MEHFLPGCLALLVCMDKMVEVGGNISDKLVALVLDILHVSAVELEGIIIQWSPLGRRWSSSCQTHETAHYAARMESNKYRK